jgi:putative phage-type endonuclease
MRYRKIEVDQGTADWHQLRHAKFTASRAPALFPESCKLGLITVFKEMSAPLKPATDNHYFQAGHMAEEKARVYCRENMGLDFRPAVLVSLEDEDFMTSLDGLIESDAITFENKWTSKDDIFAKVEAGEISPDHYVQVQWQLGISGAKLSHYFMVHQSGRVAHLEIKPDQALIAEMFQRAKAFMRNFRAGIAPEPRKRKKAQ